MHQQIVGLFQHEGSAVEAAQILSVYGCKLTAIDLVSQRSAVPPDSPGIFRTVYARHLLEQPDAMWPCAFRWGVAGSVLVEISVLIWVLLAFDSWGIQVFLASTIWKLGGILGGMLGAMVGAFRGLRSEIARSYIMHLEHGSLALVVRIKNLDAPFARGVLIESGAYDIRNVEGSFVPKPASKRARFASDPIDRTFGRENYQR